MREPHVHSEVGQLHTVLLHRPGAELKRLTPRNSDQLLFDAIPWVDRAQEEHDAFAKVLRGRGVEVLLLHELLAETLGDSRARAAAVLAGVDERAVGTDIADTLRSHLSSVDDEALAEILIAGMTFEELPAAEGASLVRRMHHAHDFAIPPLPNLLFTRDSSMWVGDRVAVAALAMPARRRESAADRAPDAAGRARDQDGLSFQTEHGFQIFADAHDAASLSDKKIMLAFFPFFPYYLD